MRKFFRLQIFCFSGYTFPILTNSANCALTIKAVYGLVGFAWGTNRNSIFFKALKYQAFFFVFVFFQYWNIVIAFTRVWRIHLELPHLKVTCHFQHVEVPFGINIHWHFLIKHTIVSPSLWELSSVFQNMTSAISLKFKPLTRIFQEKYAEESKRLVGDYSWAPGEETW